MAWPVPGTGRLHSCLQSSERPPPSLSWKLSHHGNCSDWYHRSQTFGRFALLPSLKPYTSAPPALTSPTAPRHPPSPPHAAPAEGSVTAGEVPGSRVSTGLTSQPGGTQATKSCTQQHPRHRRKPAWSHCSPQCLCCHTGLLLHQ